jgi:NifU-like protein involved in Fe-S cluster formation
VTEGAGSDANPRDGDRVSYRLEVAPDGRVSNVSAWVAACKAGTAAATRLATMAEGHSVEEIRTIGVAALSKVLDLNPDEERCALTAIGALRAALVDAQVKAAV